MDNKQPTGRTSAQTDFRGPGELHSRILIIIISSHWYLTSVQLRLDVLATSIGKMGLSVAVLVLVVLVIRYEPQSLCCLIVTAKWKIGRKRVQWIKAKRPGKDYVRPSYASYDLSSKCFEVFEIAPSDRSFLTDPGLSGLRSH
jgi:hypothetical protein